MNPIPTRAKAVKLKSISLTILLIATAAIAAPDAAAAADKDWPQFRGPTGDGTAADADPPIEWSETRNIRWKVRVAGIGWSSPVVLGDRIWLTTAIEQGRKRTRVTGLQGWAADHITLKAICLDRAGGKSLWEVTLFEIDKPAPIHELNSFATPTPVVEPGRLYCDFGAFGTACVDAATGKVLWKRRLPLDHQVGPGSSPIVYKNLLVLVRDGCDAQYITALDKTTGKSIWNTNRPPLAPGPRDTKKSFSTPLVIQSSGKTQMIVPGAQWFVSYDPATGKELWRMPHGRGFSIAPRPIFGHGLVYFSTGGMKPQLWAARVDGRHKTAESRVAWKETRWIPFMASPILVGDEIYWVSHPGIVCCADATSGKVLWHKKLSGKYMSSPVCAGGRLYFFNMDGKGTVLKAGKQFAQLAANQLEGPVVASPAVIGRTIFLRSDEHLYRIERQTEDSKK